jgi:hypothetical protein
VGRRSITPPESGLDAARYYAMIPALFNSLVCLSPCRHVTGRHARDMLRPGAGETRALCDSLRRA